MVPSGKEGGGQDAQAGSRRERAQGSCAGGESEPPAGSLRDAGRLWWRRRPTGGARPARLEAWEKGPICRKRGVPRAGHPQVAVWVQREGSGSARWAPARPLLGLVTPGGRRPLHCQPGWAPTSLGTCGRGSTPGPQSGPWRSPSAAPGLGAPWGGLARGCPPDRAVPPAVPPTVLLDEIEAAELEGNDDRLEGVLCGAVKQLKVTRAKPDSVLYLSLMYLAKMKPNIFATEGVIEVRTAARSVPGSGEGAGGAGWPPRHCAVSRRPCAASCGGMPPSASRPRGTAWCPCWRATSSWPRTRRTRTGLRFSSR